MNYYQTINGFIIDENRQVIPMEEGNPLYIGYISFLENNGTVEPTDLLSDEEIEMAYQSTVPRIASRMKFLLALLQFGITKQSIYDFIGQLDDATTREYIRIKFDDCQEFEREDQTLIEMALAFGITGQQLDQIFIASNTI